AHPDDSPVFRTENLEFMSTVLARQKLMLGRLAGILTGAVLAVLGFRLARRRTRRGGAAKAAGAPLGPAPELSEREKEILDLVAKGYTTQQIADALHLSYETIRWYRKKLLVKFDVSNAAELISLAKEYGLV
ncbi:MAG: helix-turn-helix transcriptional regulator, partial [Bacteroidales bacterium]|nr:helix-turn-helix transcriptional regulator [Bacteroidales bacterium]